MVATQEGTRNEGRLRRSGPCCALSRHPAQADGSVPQRALLRERRRHNAAPLLDRLQSAQAPPEACRRRSARRPQRGDRHFDRVEVSAGERRFKTRGLAYAAARTTSLVDTLKRIAADAGCKFEGHVRSDRRRAPRCRPDRRRRLPRAPYAGRSAGRRNARRKPVSRLRVDRRSATPWATVSARRPAAPCTPSSGPSGGSTVVVEAPGGDDQGERSGKGASPMWSLAFCRKYFAEELDGVSARRTDARGNRSSRSARRSWHSGKTVAPGSRRLYRAFLGRSRCPLRAWKTPRRWPTSRHACVGRRRLDGVRRRTPPESRESPARPGKPRLVRTCRATHRHAVRAVRVLAATANMRITYARIEKAAPELVRSVDAAFPRRPTAAATGRRRRCSRRSPCAA